MLATTSDPAALGQISPRILIAGDWRWPHHEAALEAGFRDLGWDVIRFVQPSAEDRLGVMGAKLRLGPALGPVNHRFLELVGETRPDIVFLQRCDLILPRSIRAVRDVSPRSLVFLFHNDEPFVGLRDRLKWRHLLGSLKYADATFVFRPANVGMARGLGAAVVEILPPYYVRSLHVPQEPSSDDRDYDVVFIGHYEDDWRAAALERLAGSGLRVGLFGTGWEETPAEFPWIRSQEARAVYGEEYRSALASGKLALVFLSRLNHDVWTTRCFEIPACAVAMLAPDNPSLRGYFGDAEAIYYRDGDIDSLVEAAHRASDDPGVWRSVAQAGWERCKKDGHSELDRARQIAATWSRITSSRKAGSRAELDGRSGGE